jgi:hypothetical protein
LAQLPKALGFSKKEIISLKKVWSARPKATRSISACTHAKSPSSNWRQARSVNACPASFEIAFVDYETFRHLWLEALRQCRLPTSGLYGTETLDTRNLDRSYRVYVEPLGGQDAPPFHVTAELSWDWHATNTVRGSRTDGDLLSEMLGRDQIEDLASEKPYLRVDIKLRASAPFDKPLPMPAKAAWAKWVEETMARLARIEPLLPDEVVRENRMGMTEVLGWQGSPTAKVVCGPGGELRLEGVQVAAMQIIELPRLIDNPDERDEGPEVELEDLFGRVRASLMAWMQALDHLRVL